jgi:hypothetical protein
LANGFLGEVLMRRFRGMDSVHCRVETRGPQCGVVCILIELDAAREPYRVLADEPLRRRIIVPMPVVVQRRLCISTTIRDAPDAPSTATVTQPQQPFMPWEHIDRWLGAEKFFRAGQRVYVSVDYRRQSLTVTPEYDEAARARERAQRAIERKADNDELRKVWRAQTDNRAA